MIVVNNYTYKVLPNESVDIRINPTSVFAQNVYVSLDGKMLSPSAPTLYTIHQSWEPDTAHVCVIEASFPPDTADDAQFDLSVSGQYGGEGGFKIRKMDAIHDPELTFYCSGEVQRGHAEVEPPEPWPRPKGHR